ncbi:translation initiation factor eIF 4e-like domain-containing protein [Pilaira anomala]|nr:translation initiation factor eIF 4e-like domain-containing protein [Pilaira anomala]
MLQTNNYKFKSLSPAVSAFQFQVKTPSKRDDFKNTLTTPDLSSKEEEEDLGYFQDEALVLNEQRRLQLIQLGPLPLDAEWTFWYDKFVPNLPASEYESNLVIISSVKTVQKFWSIYNNIDGPDRLGFRSNYHFMKKGIKPIWEDPMNEYGGSYNFKINKKQSLNVWKDILLLLIGENVEGWMKNTVLGVSVSSRQQADNYQIWTAHNNKNVQDGIIRAKLDELLYPAEILSFYFKMHKTHADFQKPASPNLYTKSSSDMATALSRPIEMRRKITEESIERVVQDIEKLKLRERVK